MLVGSMHRVLTHPNEEKYRRVNPANPAFARTVGVVPGGVEFLMAVGYEPVHGQLVLQRHDAALLWLGKAALEAVRGVRCLARLARLAHLARARPARLARLTSLARLARRVVDTAHAPPSGQPPPPLLLLRATAPSPHC